MTLTQWFPPDVFPVHEGVYQRGAKGFFQPICMYSYWDGKHWYVGASTVRGAKRYFKLKEKTVLTNPSWRGIADKPT